MTRMRGVPLAAEDVEPAVAAPRTLPLPRAGGAPRGRDAGRLAFVADWLPMVALLVAYELMRDLVPLIGVEPRDLRGVELWLSGGHEATLALQAAFYRAGHVGVFDVIGSVVYLMHFVLPAAAGLYLWLDSRSRYRAFAASLLVTSFLAFVTYVAMPTLPPWLGHPGDVHEIIDATIRQLHVPSWLVSVYSHRDYNVDAAFPSLHSAFPLIAAVHVGRRRRWLGVALAAWTALVWVSVVYLGEHYVVDVAAGVAYAVAAMALVAWWSRRRAGRAGRHDRDDRDGEARAAWWRASARPGSVGS